MNTIVLKISKPLSLFQTVLIVSEYEQPICCLMQYKDTLRTLPIIITEVTIDQALDIRLTYIKDFKTQQNHYIKLSAVKLKVAKNNIPEIQLTHYIRPNYIPYCTTRFLGQINISDSILIIDNDE